MVDDVSIYAYVVQAEIIDEVENETNPVTFHCRATGNPTPNISWYFNTRLLTNALDESDYNILTTTVREGVVKSLLTIRNPQLSNNGRYTCYAENIIGSDNSSRILMLNGKDKHITNNLLCIVANIHS